MTQLTILPFKTNIDIQADETVMQTLRRGGYEIEGPKHPIAVFLTPKPMSRGFAWHAV